MKSPRNLHLWLPGYIRSRLHTMTHQPRKLRKVWLMIADHFEPLVGGADAATAAARVAEWRRLWPAIASRHRDSRGTPPQYTFFYPQEEYRPELIEPLAEMNRLGIADVEIHLHHDGEGAANFVDRIEEFKEVLTARHGMLRTFNGCVVFGFIHGNWALDNSRPDGRYCGLNNEITLLRDIGCYADFTLPSVPSPTQTRLVNTIYWAVDDPAKPKSHDNGQPVMPGVKHHGDLLMVPGPLALRFEQGRLMPRIDTGEIAGYDLPTRQRARTWLKAAPRIGDSIFIKLYTHGAHDRNRDPLLKGGLDVLFDSLEQECSARGLDLHYATAWDVTRAISALETQAS